MRCPRVAGATAVGAVEIVSATNRVVLHSTSCIDCLPSRLGNCLNEKPDQPDHPVTPENEP